MPTVTPTPACADGNGNANAINPNESSFNRSFIASSLRLPAYSIFRIPGRLTLADIENIATRFQHPTARLHQIAGAMPVFGSPLVSLMSSAIQQGLATGWLIA